MNPLVLLVVASLVTYRVSRFVILDTLIDHQRRWVAGQLEKRPGPLSDKLLELMGCPYCVSVWVAAGTIAVIDLATDHSVPVPVFMWLAAATGALVVWRIVDPADDEDEDED